MKILFIYADLFPSYRNWTGHFYCGIGYLSSVLKMDGHRTALIHVTQKFSKKEEFLERVKDYTPNLIAFSSTTLTFKYVRKMAGWLLNAGLGIPVISGGIHSTLLPLEVLEIPGIDMVCVGEGEVAFRNLVKALEKGVDHRRLPGIWIKDHGKIYKNGVSPIIRDLDGLPFPDRSIFDYPNLVHEKLGNAYFMASRGCPYRCSYCSNRLLQQTYCPNQPGDYVRFRSVDNVIAEITHAREDYPFIKACHFDDDLFFLRENWAREFSEKYSKEIGLPFSCNMRPNHLNAKIASLLKKAGCIEVRMGVESGNEWIRNKILKRNLNEQQIYDAFKYCHQLGIRTESYNIVGIPYETISAILDTVKMNAHIKPNLMQVTIYYPFPKTELGSHCQEKGFVLNHKGYDFFSPRLQIITVSKRNIQFFQRNFGHLVKLYSRVYPWKSPVSKVMCSILDWLLQSSFLHVLNALFSFLRKAKSVLNLQQRVGLGPKS